MRSPPARKGAQKGKTFESKTVEMKRRHRGRRHRCRTAKGGRPAKAGSRRIPSSRLEYLPKNRLIVTTGSLYGSKKYLAVALPCDEGNWELVFSGHDNTVTVTEDDRKRHNIVAVAPGKSTYKSDLINSERNLIFANRVRHEVECTGKRISHALVLDTNPYDLKSSAKAIEKYAGFIHVPERNLGTAATHLALWAAQNRKERTRLILHYGSVDDVLATKTKFGAIYCDGMTPDWQLASMILGQGPDDYDAMPLGGVFMFTVNTRSGCANITNVLGKVKEAIHGRVTNKRDVMHMVRGASTIVTSIATIPPHPALAS